MFSGLGEGLNQTYYTLWVESKNQMAARNQIMRENPFITKLIFGRTKRIE